MRALPILALIDTPLLIQKSDNPASNTYGLVTHPGRRIGFAGGFRRYRAQVHEHCAAAMHLTQLPNLHRKPAIQPTSAPPSLRFGNVGANVIPRNGRKEHTY